MKTTQIINLTKNHILDIYGRSYPPSGDVAKVMLPPNTEVPWRDADNTDDWEIPEGTEFVGLPPEQKGVKYIVSTMTLFVAIKAGRKDCLVPALNHRLTDIRGRGNIRVAGFVDKIFPWGDPQLNNYLAAI